MDARATAWHDPVTERINLAFSSQLDEGLDDAFYPADDVDCSARTLRYELEPMPDPTRPLVSLTIGEAFAAYAALQRVLAPVLSESHEK